MAKVYAQQVSTNWNKIAKKSSLATKTDQKNPKVSAKFLKMVDRLMAKHDDVLRELADR